MIKVNIRSLLLHLHALELQLCTNVLRLGLVLNLHEMSNHNRIEIFLLSLIVYEEISVSFCILCRSVGKA